MWSGLRLRLLTPKVTLLIFIHHIWMWDCPCPFCHHCLSAPWLLAFLPHLCISAPLTHLDDCGFFKSLDAGLPHSSIFWQFWVLFVLSLIVIPFCGCTRRLCVSTYASILTGSWLHSNKFVKVIQWKEIILSRNGWNNLRQTDYKEAEWGNWGKWQKFSLSSLQWKLLGSMC